MAKMQVPGKKQVLSPVLAGAVDKCRFNEMTNRIIPPVLHLAVSHRTNHFHGEGHGVVVANPDVWRLV